MKIRVICFAVVVVCLSLSLSAQTTNSTATPASATVPRLITFSGTLSHVAIEADQNGVVLASGAVPTHVVAITFSLYTEQEGGTPLWSEVQNVHVDSGGRYTVHLGATKPDGLPLDIFTSVQAQWLGVQPQDHAEQPRVLLVSVPYALKSGDAETFGGLPPSAFVLAPPSETNLPAGSGAGDKGKSSEPLKGPHHLPISGSGTPNYLPLWTTASSLASSSIYQSPSGGIGIGTTSPGAGLTVSVVGETSISGLTANGGSQGVYGINIASSGAESYGVSGQTESGAASGVFGYNAATSGSGSGVFGQSDSPHGSGVYGIATATSGAAWGVYGSSQSSGAGGVLGVSLLTSGTTSGVFGLSQSPTGFGGNFFNNADTGSTQGVHGESASPDGIGVYGTSPGGVGVYGNNTSGYGVWGQSSSGVGVQGTCAPTGSNSCYNGVAGLNESTSGPANGLWGLTQSPQGNAVYMVNSGGGNLLYGTQSNGGNGTFYVQGNGSGFFGGNLQVNGQSTFNSSAQINGNLTITGNLIKGSGSFKIDDPLDPANKYLSHSFVESPDMMNIYNGVVRLNARGEAWITLPEYFEALNRDFRYQLTSIGVPQPRLYIAREVQGNRFKIGGGGANAKVSWQVTGIRQDAYAKAHRIPTEEDKPVEERGYYLHPDAFGAPESQSVRFARAHHSTDRTLATDARPGN